MNFSRKEILHKFLPKKKNFTENTIVEKDLPKKNYPKRIYCQKKFTEKKILLKKIMPKKNFASKILFSLKELSWVEIQLIFNLES